VARHVVRRRTGSGGFLGLPRYSIGSPSGDPAAGAFSATTIPGLVAADQATALALYSLITGRVSQVQTGKVVDPATLTYSDKVARENWTSAWFNGVFVNDSWRLKPNFTLKLRPAVGGRASSLQTISGIAVSRDYSNLLGPSSALFQPGTLNGRGHPVLHRGKYGSKTDWVNPAPACRLCLDAALRPEESGGPHARQRAVDGHPRQATTSPTTTKAPTCSRQRQATTRAITTAPSAAGQRFRPGALTLQTTRRRLSPSRSIYTEVWPQSDFTFGSTGFSTMKDKLQLPSVQAFNIGSSVRSPGTR